MRHPLGEHRTNLGQGRKELLHLGADLLDTFHIRTLNLHANRCLDAGELHVEAVLDRHRPGVGEARKLQLSIHLLNQLFVGHPCRPLAPRLQHDGGVVHVQGGVVCGAVRASDGAENALHFGEGADDPVLFLE